VTSGKQARLKRKAQAAPPPVRSKGAPRPRRKASPKVLAAAAVLVALVAAGVAIAVVVSNGSSSSSGTTPTRGSLVNALPDAAVAERLLKGIPQSGNVLGSPNAPVTMIEYIDLQCSACRAFETEIMPSIIPKYVRTGKVRVEARPIVAIGPDSARGVTGALAAGRQNRLFNFAQILYYNQGPENGGWLTEGEVQDAAASIPGLDVPAFLQSKDSSAVNAQAKRFEDEANADGVTGTPTLLVGKTGGKLRDVAPGVVPDVPTLSAALDKALR
jgi:protein-disulfide isomerase